MAARSTLGMAFCLLLACFIGSVIGQRELTFAPGDMVDLRGTTVDTSVSLVYYNITIDAVRDLSMTISLCFAATNYDARFYVYEGLPESVLDGSVLPGVGARYNFDDQMTQTSCSRNQAKFSMALIPGSYIVVISGLENDGVIETGDFRVSFSAGEMNPCWSGNCDTTIDDCLTVAQCTWTGVFDDCPQYIYGFQNGSQYVSGVIGNGYCDHGLACTTYNWDNYDCPPDMVTTPAPTVPDVEAENMLQCGDAFEGEVGFREELKLYLTVPKPTRAPGGVNLTISFCDSVFSGHVDILDAKTNRMLGYGNATKCTFTVPLAEDQDVYIDMEGSIKGGAVYLTAQCKPRNTTFVSPCAALYEELQAGPCGTILETYPAYHSFISESGGTETNHRLRGTVASEFRNIDIGTGTGTGSTAMTCGNTPATYLMADPHHVCGTDCQEPLEATMILFDMNQCSRCLSDSECNDGNVCRQGSCVPTCEDDDGCANCKWEAGTGGRCHLGGCLNLDEGGPQNYRQAYQVMSRTCTLNDEGSYCGEFMFDFAADDGLVTCEDFFNTGCCAQQLVDLAKHCEVGWIAHDTLDMYNILRKRCISLEVEDEEYDGECSDLPHPECDGVIDTVVPSSSPSLSIFISNPSQIVPTALRIYFDIRGMTKEDFDREDVHHAFRVSFAKAFAFNYTMFHIRAAYDCPEDDKCGSIDEEPVTRPPTAPPSTVFMDIRRRNLLTTPAPDADFVRAETTAWFGENDAVKAQLITKLYNLTIVTNFTHEFEYSLQHLDLHELYFELNITIQHREVTDEQPEEDEVDDPLLGNAPIIVMVVVVIVGLAVMLFVAIRFSQKGEINNYIPEEELKRMWKEQHGDDADNEGGEGDVEGQHNEDGDDDDGEGHEYGSDYEGVEHGDGEGTEGESGEEKSGDDSASDDDDSDDDDSDDDDSDDDDSDDDDSDDDDDDDDDDDNAGLTEKNGVKILASDDKDFLVQI